MTFETRLDIVKYYLMDRMLKPPGAKTAIGDRERERERALARDGEGAQEGRRKRRAKAIESELGSSPPPSGSISSSQEMILASWSI